MLKQLFDVGIYYPVFKIGLVLGAIPARLGRDGLTRALMRMNAACVLFIRRGSAKKDILDAGREWKRMFPRQGMQTILSSDDETVYAETRTWCPLRGTGDVHACHTMMEFDRRLMETIGGQFIVLQSQAEPGVTTCRVAIRRTGMPTDDLIPAHLK